MGEHWNTEGFYKRTYRHTIADARYSCAVVGIPMGGSLILHGQLCSILLTSAQDSHSPFEHFIISS